MSYKTFIWIAQLSFWVIYSPWRRNCWNLRWNSPLGRKDVLWLLLLTAVGPSSFLPPREKLSKINNFLWTLMVEFLEVIRKPQRKTLPPKKKNKPCKISFKNITCKRNATFRTFIIKMNIEHLQYARNWKMWNAAKNNEKNNLVYNTCIFDRDQKINSM